MKLKIECSCSGNVEEEVKLSWRIQGGGEIRMDRAFAGSSLEIHYNIQQHQQKDVQHGTATCLGTILNHHGTAAKACLQRGVTYNIALCNI